MNTEELIKRLEAATGPDLILDLEIRETVEGWKNVGGGWREALNFIATNPRAMEPCVLDGR